MTRKERILAAVNHQPVDRIPTDMWATPEVQEMLYEHFDISVGKNTQTDSIGLLGGHLSRGVEALLELWDKLDIDGIIDHGLRYLERIYLSMFKIHVSESA